MLIDIGANLSSQRFDGDIAEVLQHAKNANLEKIVITGTSIAESQAAIDLCTTHTADFPDMLYATAGIHPHSADQFDPQSTSMSLRRLAAHPSVVAIGETGLDFFRNLAAPDIQQRSFEAHLELAIDLVMPLFLHERMPQPGSWKYSRPTGINSIARSSTALRATEKPSTSISTWTCISVLPDGYATRDAVSTCKKLSQISP